MCPYEYLLITFSSPKICGWGRNVFMGYLNRETETREVLSEDEEWLRLGDLGYTDADGFLTVVGSEGNFIHLRTGEIIVPEKV